MSTSDKAKETAKGIFAKTKTEIARTKQKVLEKVGKAEETVDISFNQERERFFNHYKAVKLLRKNLIKFLEVARDLSESQTRVAEDFYNIYEPTASMYNATLKNQDNAKLCENSRTQFDQQIRQDLLDPLTKYVNQFKEIKARINELEVRRVDMDRYSRDVKSLIEKGKTGRQTSTEAKYDAAKANYNNLNEELLRDMPRLYADRLKFFEPACATYLSCTAEYYRQCAKFTSDVTPLIAQVNRQSIHDHPRVITSVEQTSMNHKITAAVDENRRSIYAPSTTGAPEEVPAQRRATYSPSSPSSFGPSTPVSSVPPTQNIPPQHPPRLTPSAPPVLRARGIYDFNGQDASELSFKVGDVINILKNTGDWWEGELNGKKGLLPSNYVQLI